MSTLTGLLGLGGLAASAYLPYENSGSQIDYLKSQIPSYVSQAGDITNRAVQEAQFSPFTVRTGTGGTVDVNAQGGVTQALAGDELGLQTGLLQGATGAMNKLGQGYDTSGLYSQAFQGAGTALQGATTTNPYIEAQQNALQGLLAGQLGQYGTFGQSLSGLTGTALQGAEQGLLQSAPNVTDAYAGISPTGTQLSNTYQGIRPVNYSNNAANVADQFLSAGQQALQQTSPTADSLFSQIRAMQSPEEERQRLQLENRLAAQGRLGVSTAAYGGTPEQLALEKAQAEARNSAAFQATQMADQLASSQQARAQQLTQMGMSADQIANQLKSEGFSQAMGLAGANLGVQQAQAGLDAQLFSQQMGLAGAGIQAQQAQSALQSEQQARAQQLAQLGLGGTQAQQAMNTQDISNILGIQQGSLGNFTTQQQLQQGAAGLGSSLFGLGSAASMLPSQYDAAQLANLSSMLTGAYTPQQQQLAALGAASPFSQLATSAALSRAEQLSSGGQYGLEALAAGNQSIAGLESARVNALANTLSGLFTATGASETSPFELLVKQLTGG